VGIFAESEEIWKAKSGVDLCSDLSGENTFIHVGIVNVKTTLRTNHLMTPRTSARQHIRVHNHPRMLVAFAICLQSTFS
jgi:hypothetical protein